MEPVPEPVPEPQPKRQQTAKKHAPPAADGQSTPPSPSTISRRLNTPIRIENIPYHLYRWLRECGVQRGVAIARHFTVEYMLTIGNETELQQCPVIESFFRYTGIPFIPLERKDHFNVAVIEGEPFRLSPKELPETFSSDKLGGPFQILGKKTHFHAPSSRLVERLVQIAYIHYMCLNTVGAAVRSDLTAVAFANTHNGWFYDNWDTTDARHRSNVLGADTLWKSDTTDVPSHKQNLYITKQWLQFWDALARNPQLRPVLPPQPWKFIPDVVYRLRSTWPLALGLTEHHRKQETKFDVAFGLQKDPRIVEREMKLEKLRHPATHLRRLYAHS